MKKLVMLVLVLVFLGCADNPVAPIDPSLYDNYFMNISTNIGVINYENGWIVINHTNIIVGMNVAVYDSTNPRSWVYDTKTWIPGKLKISDPVSNYNNQMLYITLHWIVWK